MFKSLLSALVMLFAWASLAFAAVDINSANEAELDKIKGVGPVKAKAIMEERKKNGPFKNLEDVATRVKGIGEKTVAGWKKSGEVTVGSGAVATKPAAATPAAPVPAKTEAAKAEPKKTEAKKDDVKKDDKKSDKK